MREQRIDKIGRWTAIFATAVLLVALLIVGDYSGALGVVIGVCLGVANAPFIIRSLQGAESPPASPAQEG